MEESRVSLCFAHAGALGANWVISAELAYAFMPRHISVVTTNDSDATIKVGTTADDNALITAQVFGDSGDPAEYGPSDFADADYQYSKGDVLMITVDYDGASGTPAADPVIVITGLTGA